MDRVAQAVGAELYNVDAQPRHVVHFSQEQLYHDVPLPKNLNQFNLIVSVAKLKTHNLTYMTGAVKNLLGLVPGAGKKAAHLLAPRPREFATLLCDLYDLLRPVVGFVDGVVGMEGNGPSNGSLRHVELIAASADPVALDSFCAQVMGLEPMRVPMLRQCQERGLGAASPERIQVRGEPAAAFAPEGFAKPPAYVNTMALNLLPRWAFRSIFAMVVSRHAVVQQDRCRRCGECAANCPSGAISLEDASGQYHVDARKCFACYCCTEVCPWDAIAMEASPPMRLASRLLGRSWPVQRKKAQEPALLDNVDLFSLFYLPFTRRPQREHPTRRCREQH